jgi:hypothetical protein
MRLPRAEIKKAEDIMRSAVSEKGSDIWEGNGLHNLLSKLGYPLRKE